MKHLTRMISMVLAVVLLFWSKLNPFSPKKDVEQKKDTWKKPNVIKYLVITL